MKRFSILPCTLYRFQPKAIPKLLDKKTEEKKGNILFDYVLGQNKLYNPLSENSPYVSNGLILQPLCLHLAEMLDSKYTKFIYELPEAGQFFAKQKLITIEELRQKVNKQIKQLKS